MTESETQKVVLEGVESDPEEQASTLSFGWRRRYLSPLGEGPEISPSPAANQNGPPTGGVQKVDVPDRSPRKVPVAIGGLRGFLPAYQWEGEVREVTETGFTARLVPYEKGVPQRDKSEFTDFDFVDLSDPSDVELVTPGAVFYWTLGRAKNEAGTITNTSLVRFRRLPKPGIYQQQLAEAEANELFREFGGSASTE